MSLITCCPSCGTKFRVVADQLRISEGWVRCGRCQEIFDAAQALQEAPAPRAANVAAPSSDQTPSSSELVQPLPEPEPEPEPALSNVGYELPVPPETQDEFWLDVPGEDVGTAAAMGPGLMQESALLHASPWEPEQPLPAEQAQAELWGQALSEAILAKNARNALLSTSQVQSEDLALAADGAVAEDASNDIAAPLPSFVKQAQRKAWWSQPAVRFVMGMLVIFLPFALLLQIAMHERNTLVAWKPQWRPVFDAMCVALRCEIAPRKSIASVVLTGSSFNQDTQPHHYRLGLSIQNQSSMAVATPAVELTLTDAQDQVLVRKVFSPKEIGAPVELAARSEWSGSLPVQTQGLHLTVSGYRVMAFYP